LVCCTRQDIWHGVQFDDKGNIELVALMPQCGCVSMTNTSSGLITLRASLHGVKIGEAQILQGETKEYRFDWAGPENVDRYVIAVYDQAGEKIAAKKVIRLNQFATIVNCHNATCEYGDLQMNKAYLSKQDIGEDLSKRHSGSSTRREKTTSTPDADKPLNREQGKPDIPPPSPKPSETPAPQQ
jgi:hypothetical protein